MPIPQRPRKSGEQENKNYKEEKAYERDHRIEDELDDDDELFDRDELDNDDEITVEEDPADDEDFAGEIEADGASDKGASQTRTAGTDSRETHARVASRVSRESGSGEASEGAEGEISQARGGTGERTGSKIPQQQTVTNDDSPAPEKEEPRSILYSRKAYDEGYRFNMFPLDDQKLTNQLYISEDEISNLILASQRFCHLGDDPEDQRHFDYGWGLSIDGWHYGIVYDCRPSAKNHNNYILQLLMTDKDIRNFKFSLSLIDPVYAAIKQERNIGANIFRAADYSDLCGEIVIFRIKNVATAYDKVFSNIDAIHFTSKHERQLLNRMAIFMEKQSREFTRGAN